MIPHDGSTIRTSNKIGNRKGQDTHTHTFSKSKTVSTSLRGKEWNLHGAPSIHGSSVPMLGPCHLDHSCSIWKCDGREAGRKTTEEAGLHTPLTRACSDRDHSRRQHVWGFTCSQSAEHRNERLAALLDANATSQARFIETSQVTLHESP